MSNIPIRKSILLTLIAILLITTFNFSDALAAPSTPKDTETKTYLIKYKDEEKGKKALKSIQKQKKESKDQKHLKKHVQAKLTKEEFKQLKNDPNIEYIEQDSVVKKTSESVSSSVYQINAQLVQQLGITGVGVNVAIMDSGIDMQNNEINIVGGVSFVPNDSTFDDLNGHGTFISGIIGALKDDKGLIGVAPNANLYAIKVLDQSGIGTYSQVIDGIEWAIDHKIDIVCMSFSGQNDSQALNDALQLAYDNGILLIAAVGNEGMDDSIGYPAKYNTVIATGAVDQQNQRASFSNKGPELELVAPGVNIEGLSLTSSYTTQSGTSPAAAYVSGVAALLKSSNTNLSNKQIRQALQESATPLGDHALFGFGLVNASLALVKVDSMVTTIPESGGGTGGTGGTEVPNVELPPAQVEKTIEDIIQEFSLTEEWIQAEIDKGNSIQDIYKALYIQKIEAKTYEQALSEIKVVLENESQSAESQIINDLPIEELRKLQDNSNKVYAAINTPVSIDNAALNNVKLRSDQAPFSINNNNESVSTLSGGMSTSVTDLSLPGRNGMSFDLTRIYDSNSSQFYEMDVETVVTDTVENQIDGYYLDFYEDLQKESQKYKVTARKEQYLQEANSCLSNATIKPYEMYLGPLPGLIEEMYTTWDLANNRKNLLNQTWKAYEVYSAWTCYSNNYKWRYHDANIVGSASILEDDSYNTLGVRSPSNYQVSYYFQEYQEAVDYAASINANKGANYENDYEWYGNDSQGRYRFRHYISNNPRPTIVPNIIQVPGTLTTVNNKTLTAFDEQRFPIGKGWKWNISSIEKKNDKQYLHDDNGGVYEISGNELKNYPWKDIYIGLDSSVYVNGEYSEFILKNIVTGNKQYFNYDGLLMQIVDSYGNDITFSYDNFPTYGKQLQKVTDAIGNTITINYLANQVTLTKYVGAVPQVVTYNKSKQSGKEILNNVVDPMNLKTTYNYSIKNATFNFVSGAGKEVSNPFALLTQITAPTGAISLFTYESSAVKRYMGYLGYNYQYRIAASENKYKTTGSDISTKRKTFLYGTDMNQTFGQDFSFSTTVSDSLTKTIYSYFKRFDDFNTPGAVSLMDTYQSSVSNPKIIYNMSYVYDNPLSAVPTAIGKYLSKTENNQTIFAESHNIWRSYDDYGNLLQEVTDAQFSNAGSYFYKNYEYDPSTHWLKSVSQPINDNLTQYTEFSYNDNGSPTKTTVRENNHYGKLLSETDIEYDSFGNAINITIVDDIRNKYIINEYSPTYGYAYLTNQSIDVTDIDGHISTVTQSVEYNQANETIAKYIDGKGNETKYTYDKLDRVTNALFSDTGNISIVYNDLANEVTTTDEAGVKSKIKWNPLGWRIEAGLFESGVYKSKEILSYDTFGRVVSSQDAKGNIGSSAYDSWDRVISITSPDKSKVSMTYDDINRTKIIKDAEANEIKESMDILGRTIKREELRTNGASESYLYDNVGNLMETKDAYNVSTEYQYDALSRVTSVIDPENRETVYRYSLANQLTELQYPDGNTSYKSYDEMGRLIKEINPLGETEKNYYDSNSNLTKTVDAKGQQQTYIYNSRDFLTNINGLDSVGYTYDKAGKRLSMTDSTGITSYEYNTVGQLSKMTYPDNKNIQFLYDAVGNRSKLTEPFGQIINYVFDKNNRLTNVKSPTTDEASYKYKLNGLLAEIKQLNGVISTYSYLGTQISKLEQKNSIGTPLNTFIAGYDRNANITSKTDNTTSYSFTYDTLNRIKSNSQNSEQYTYDVRGNRQTFKDTDQGLNLNFNSYEYDSRNQLKKVIKPDSSFVNYKYNGDGLLYERTENAVTTRYYYDGNQVIAEGTVASNGVVTLKARYIRGIGLIARADAAGGKSYYLSNIHGDIVELRNATTGSGNSLLNKYTYDIWGNPLTTQESITQPFRFSGEMWDNSANLQYLRARWYDPSIGRFINEDTYEGDIKNSLSLNLYSYVTNNPLKYTDPSGHCAVSDWRQGGDCILDFTPGVGAVKSVQEYFTGQNWYTGEELSRSERIIGLAGVIPAGKIAAKGIKSAVKGISKFFSKAKKVEKIIPCNCFVAGTKILTDNGEKAIEDIEVGDKVLSKNDETGETGYKEVTQLFRNEKYTTYKLTVGNQVIETTNNHPFWVEGKGWVLAVDLQIGDNLQQSNGNHLTIDKIEVVNHDEMVKVYNFTVADFHTYFVSDLGIWVHNTNCVVGDLTSKGRKFTKHGADQANDRGYTPDMVDDIVDNWTNKGYQPGGRTVYGLRKTDGYHVVVLDKDNNIISVIGGAKGSNSLPNWDKVKTMMKNTGGYSDSPFSY